VDTADLFVTTTVDSQQLKSVFQLVVERLRERSIAQYAAMAGVDANLLVQAAQEFAAAGKQAVANMYRGTCQNTNGTYATLAVYTLNLLAGNFDWAGGNSGGGSHWHETNGGGKPGSVDVMKVPNGVSPKGIRITRYSASYEKDAPNIFARDGYPAKRPWFPMGTLGVYQEVLPSIYEQYPYPAKALFTFWNAWPYSTPASKEIFEQTVADESKLPLFVAFDTEMGQVSAWADFILPDTTILEKWSTPHVSPAMLVKISGFRQPTIGSFDGKPWDAPFDPAAKNDYRGLLPNARLVEDVFIDLGKRLGLPGVGEGAFEDGSALHNAWDWYRKMVTNFAVESGKTVEDVIAKGGVFDPPEKRYGSNGKLGKAFAKIVHFYQERAALTIDSMTGKPFDGLFKHEPTRDVLDRIVDDSAEYPFQVITYKNIFHAMARTAMNPSLLVLRPTNFVEMNASDGRALGLETGDPVRVISPTGSIEKNAMVLLTECIRPGVVAVAHSYGLWALSTSPFYINGRRTSFDQKRSSGIAINPIMRLDPVLGNVALQDKVGGSVSFQETRVRIEKLTA
jgi:anaerobic selenocysteine-containing dehydrogenase